MPGGEMGDAKADASYVEREARRLQLSIDDALAKEHAAQRPLRRVVAVHFPPLYANQMPTFFSRVIEEFRPEVCVYGHLHGEGIPAGFVGVHERVRYVLASCDAAGFRPQLLLDSAAHS
jgi:predicted phosphohydrolase